MFGHFDLLGSAIYLVALWGKCAQAFLSQLTPFLYTAYVVMGTVAGVAALIAPLPWFLPLAIPGLLLAQILTRTLSQILNQIVHQVLSQILNRIQIWVLTQILTWILALTLTVALKMGLKEPTLQKFALFLTLPPGFLMLFLPHKLIPLQKEIFGIAVQFHIQKIQSFNALLDFLIDLYTRGPSGIILGKGRNEVHVEGLLKQILGLPLKFSEAKECHVLQI